MSKPIKYATQYEWGKWVDVYRPFMSCNAWHVCTELFALWVGFGAMGIPLADFPHGIGDADERLEGFLRTLERLPRRGGEQSVCSGTLVVRSGCWDPSLSLLPRG